MPRGIYPSIQGWLSPNVPCWLLPEGVGRDEVGKMRLVSVGGFSGFSPPQPPRQHSHNPAK